MKIPFVDLKSQYLSIKSEIDQEVLKVLESGSFVLGENVTNFEETMSLMLKSHVLTCASGSDALFLSLMVADVRPGDEVITTPFTFFATAGSVSRLGAVPVFADINEETFTIDPNSIQKKITSKTKAIIPVHIFGNPCDMNGIDQITKNTQIKVIEDVCQAVGSRIGEWYLGTFGDFGCFSFFPTKNLGAYGDGGMICIKNSQHYDLIKKLRVHGSGVKYFHEMIGINSRLDSLQAAILNVKFKYLNKWNAKRIEIAHRYTKYFETLIKDQKIKVIKTLPNTTNVYHQYPITCDKRDELMNFLKEKEISAGVYYPLCLHLQKCYENLNYKKGDLPISEKISEKVLSIPIYPEMTDLHIEYVTQSVIEFFSKI